MITTITEFRQIFFSEEDVKSALVALNEKQKKGLLKGPIKEITITKNDADEISAKLIVDIMIGGETEEVVVAGPFLAAVMLNFCFEAGIPVPKKSKKKIDFIDNQMILQITIDGKE